jgi:hypothetical protein
MVYGVVFDNNGCTNTDLGGKETQHFNHQVQSLHTSVSVTAENLFHCSHSGEFGVSNNTNFRVEEQLLTF